MRKRPAKRRKTEGATQSAKKGSLSSESESCDGLPDLTSASESLDETPGPIDVPSTCSGDASDSDSPEPRRTDDSLQTPTQERPPQIRPQIRTRWMPRRSDVLHAFMGFWSLDRELSAEVGTGVDKKK